MSSPEDSVWYSARCSYYTFDWSKLDQLPVRGSPVNGGIPCCPICKSPGFIASKTDWENGVNSFDNNQPGYKKFIDENHQKCRAGSIGELWRQQQKQKSQ